MWNNVGYGVCFIILLALSIGKHVHVLCGPHGVCLVDYKL
jgi:hypothetical protein